MLAGHRRRICLATQSGTGSGNSAPVTGTYRVTSVPPSLTLFNTGWDYQLISGWTDALDGCPDMAAGRRDYLKEQLGLITGIPDA